MFKVQRQRGQGLVEFALILPALLMIVLSIIEGALLFQAYLAVQHAAREAARYAVTYQPPLTYSEEQGLLLLQGIDVKNPAYPDESKSEWYHRRVQLIKERARDQAVGIRLTYDVLETPETSNFMGLEGEPGFFGVRVFGSPAFDKPVEADHPGKPGLGVQVEVWYRWEPLDPLIQMIVPQGVPLKGRVTMINEGIQVGMGAQAPPTIPPIPSVPAPTALPTDDELAPPTVTPTPTWTPTPTPPPPTPTPTGAYVILTGVDGAERHPWLLEDVADGYVELYQHSGSRTYRVYWTNNCGQRTFLNMSLTTDPQGRARAPLPDPNGLLPDNSYLCKPHVKGQIYQAQLSTCDASAVNCNSAANHTAWGNVSVLVPFKYPDLVIERIDVPTPVAAGSPVIVEVVIRNDGEETVTNTFDIDIYMDPEHTPILPGQPGLVAAGGGPAKQWYGNDIPPQGSVIMKYSVVFPTGGDHKLWAQVDTSARIEEETESNNIYGPAQLMALCSEQSDDFDPPSLDAKWALAEIGSGTGSGGGASVTADGKARVEGAGSHFLDGGDGRFYMLNQGAYLGDLEMTVKVTDYPAQEDGSMAGLMVRESLSPGARYAAIGVVANNGGAPAFQALVRETDGTMPVNPCGGASNISAFGEGVWVRIVREGDLFTLYTSTNGEDWNTSTCLQVALSGFAINPVPGIFMAAVPGRVRMDTGWRSPTANAADLWGDDNGFEVSPEGAYSDGGNEAQSIDNATGGNTNVLRTDRHRYYNYDLGIPTDATIEGLEVRLDWWLDSNANTNILGIDLSWDGGANWSSIQSDSTEPTSERTVILGGASDTWGRAWSPGGLNNGNFRVRVSAYSRTSDRDFYLDWLPVRVTYVAGSSTLNPDAGQFDQFQLCPLSDVPVSVRERPPLLRECGNVIANSDFVGGSLLPWVDGTEGPAVTASGRYSCDRDGRDNTGYSMFFLCDRVQGWPYEARNPWAYHEFTVPSFISTTEAVTVAMNVSLYYGVPPKEGPADNPFEGTAGRAEDKLYLSVTGPNDVPVTTSSVEVTHGGLADADREEWHAFQADLAPLFPSGSPLPSYVGQPLRLRFESPNVDTDGDGLVDGDSQFYIDQVRCEVCTTVKPPDYESNTVRRLGGALQVLLYGNPTPMEGVDVWAMQLPDGVTPPQDLGFYTTYSIHDSTYNFYNLNPGTYRIYAEAWVSGALYTTSTTVVIDQAGPGQVWLGVDLLLQ
jgi:hypothetical protein